MRQNECRNGGIMLDESDNLARKVAYAKGKNDMAQAIYLRWRARKEFDNELFVELCEIMREADKEYADYQHKYIDSVGGNERLKV